MSETRERFTEAIFSLNRDPLGYDNYKKYVKNELSNKNSFIKNYIEWKDMTVEQTDGLYYSKKDDKFYLVFIMKDCLTVSEVNIIKTDNKGNVIIERKGRSERYKKLPKEWSKLNVNYKLYNPYEKIRNKKSKQ